MAMNEDDTLPRDKDAEEVEGERLQAGVTRSLVFLYICMMAAVGCKLATWGVAAVIFGVLTAVFFVFLCYYCRLMGDHLITYKPE